MPRMKSWEVRFVRTTVKWDWPCTTARTPDSMIVQANSAAHAAGVIRTRFYGATVHCAIPVGVV